MRGAVFRLAQPIGVNSANDEADLKGTRPVLEKLLGERRGRADAVDPLR